ncbi:MAG TPA: hypothetical protein DE042_00815 [Colwellia sp.]|nr:hypothetical protein [Colwellia sp.]
MVNNDDFSDNIKQREEMTEQTIERQHRELAYKQSLAQVQRNLLARKCIDDLMEKRLKELFDDSDDW